MASGSNITTAVRVPTITGSLSIISALVQKSTTPDAVNQIFRDSAKTPRWEKTLKVSDDPLVSTDIIGEPYGAIIDSQMTKVLDGNLVTIFSWYDNEAGYTHTLIEHAIKAGNA